MSLLKINEGEVVDSSGFSIRISHNRITYFEGEKAMSIDIEHCVNPYKIAVFTDTIKKWRRPFQNEAISKQDKITIEERIKECLDFLSVNYSLE